MYFFSVQVICDLVGNLLSYTISRGYNNYQSLIYKIRNILNELKPYLLCDKGYHHFILLRGDDYIIKGTDIGKKR